MYFDHIVDISHPDFEEQINTVNQTLADIKVIGKPTIIIFNKIDAYTFIEKEEDDLTPATKENLNLEQFKNTWMAKIDSPCIFISATKKQNFQELKDMLYKEVRKVYVKRYPYNDFLY